jgi:hypothetical protein
MTRTSTTLAILAVIGAGSLFIAGCDDKRETPVPQPAAQAGGTEYPEWMSDPSFDGKVGEIGIAEPQPGGVNFTRDLALFRARKNLAVVLNATVTRLMEESITSGGEAALDANGKRVVQELAQLCKKDFGRQLTKADVSGARPGKSYQMANGDFVVRVYLDAELFKKYAQEAKAAAAAVIEANRAAFQKANINHEELSKKLDAQLDRENGLAAEMAKDRPTAAGTEGPKLK